MAFDAQRILTYRAAQALIIHLDDLVGRLPAGPGTTAKKEIVWDVVEHRIPAVITAILD